MTIHQQRDTNYSTVSLIEYGKETYMIEDSLIGLSFWFDTLQDAFNAFDECYNAIVDEYNK